MESQLLTAEAVADRLNVSVQALYQMRYLQDAPPAIKVGARLRWRTSDVDDWIDQRAERCAA